MDFWSFCPIFLYICLVQEWSSADPQAEKAGSDMLVDQQRGWPEPSPNWTEAIKEWGWLWLAHVYGFGILFALLTLYALFLLLRVRKTVFTKQKLHHLVMTLLLVGTSFGRSITLLWDPYASSGTTSSSKSLLMIISWGTATACLTSAFSIMLLIFLETTKIKLGPPKLRNLPFLASVTLANVGYLILSDLIVWFRPEAKAMILICHVTFAAWGLAISVGYFIAGLRMWHNLKPSLTAPTQNNRCLIKEIKKLKRLFAFMSAASIFGLSNFSVAIYVSVSELGVFSEEDDAKIWPWFVVQSTIRTLEILMIALVFLIAVANHNTCSSGTNENSSVQERFSLGNSSTRVSEFQEHCHGNSHAVTNPAI